MRRNKEFDSSPDFPCEQVSQTKRGGLKPTAQRLFVIGRQVLCQTCQSCSIFRATISRHGIKSFSKVIQKVTGAKES
jgi:hypothetical protein